MLKTRSKGLKNIRMIIKHTIGLNDVDEAALKEIILQRRFLELFFSLFDWKFNGYLDKSSWIGNLKNWAQVSNIVTE